MKQFLAWLLFLVLAMWMVVASDRAAIEKVTKRCEEYGRVVGVERRVFDKGPFWWVHKNERVYFIQFEDGRQMFVRQPIFGDLQFSDQTP